MAVILLSDTSPRRTSDEHRAYELSAGRRLTPVGSHAVKTVPASPGTAKAAEEDEDRKTSATRLPASD